MGAHMEGGRTLYEADMTISTVIVIGNEGKGISRVVKEACDFLVTIPMYGNLNSLNASVAAAVLMYEAVRQRQSEIIMLKDILIVDGYNVIFAWTHLKNWLMSH